MIKFVQQHSKGKSMPYKIISLLALSHLLSGADWIQMPNSIIDTKQHLQWQDNTAIEEYEEKWNMSKQHCNGLYLDSFHDWRLPTQKELILLSHNKTVKANFSHITKQIFWSSDEDKNNPLNAYAIYIGNAHQSSNDKCEKNSVICVRNVFKRE